MTQYLELAHDFDPKIIGNKDGLAQLATAEDNFVTKNKWFNELYSHEHFYKDRWIKWANLPNYIQPIHELALARHSKLTDIIVPGLEKGIVVNDKTRDILEKVNLPHHKYVEVSFLIKEKLIEGYWWLVYTLDTGEYTVNFANSEFNMKYYTKQTGSTIKVNNYNEYIDVFNKTGKALPATKLVFNSNFNQELDLWGVQFLSLQNGYISTKLNKLFIDNNVLGYITREPRCKLVFSE